MAPRATHRRVLMLGVLLAAITTSSLLPSGAAAHAHRARCGYHVHVAASYITHLHAHETAGVFGIYLIAPQRYVQPNGAICVNVIRRHNLPLDHVYTARFGSRMDVVHSHHSIFRGLGLHPQLFDDGVYITFLPGTLAAIEQCPGCFRFEVWPRGYRGARPELSGRL